MKKQNIDPWGSVNVENYERLMKEFGINSFSNVIKKVPKPSLYMRRGIIFGHLGFDVVLDAINKKQKFFIIDLWIKYDVKYY